MLVEEHPKKNPVAATVPQWVLLLLHPSLPSNTHQSWARPLHKQVPNAECTEIVSYHASNIIKFGPFHKNFGI